MNLIDTLNRLRLDANACDPSDRETTNCECLEAIETVRAMQEALSDLTENGLGTASVKRAREALRRAEGSAG